MYFGRQVVMRSASTLRPVAGSIVRARTSTPWQIAPTGRSRAQHAPTTCCSRVLPRYCRSPARCAGQLREQGEVLGPVAEQLRVPLHREHIGRAVDLDALDVAVLVARDHAEALAELGHHLVVERVHAEGGGADDAGEARR